MPTAALYSVDGKEVGTVDVDDSVFGAEVNEPLLREAVLMYEANRRAGTASTKTRAEVRGGGRKPWRQKGTGRARHGSIRSPLWRGGGITFGPRPRDFSYSIPKKARRAALRSALSAKLQDGRLYVLDALELPEPRTKAMVGVVEALGLEGTTLVVTADHDTNVVKSVRNIPGVTTRAARALNSYDVLVHENLLMTRDAVSVVEEVLAR